MFAPIMIKSRRRMQDKNIGRIRVKILSLNNVIILYNVSVSTPFIALYNSYLFTYV